MKLFTISNNSIVELIQFDDNFGNKTKNLQIIDSHNFLTPKGFAISHNLLLYLFGIKNNIKFSLNSTNEEIEIINGLVNAEGFNSKELDLLIEYNSLCYPLAVRSSSNFEDSMEFSFAGVLKSALNVTKKTIYSSISDVFSSSFNAQLIKFLKLFKFENDIQFGMIIQEMVYGIYSGILFTKHPYLKNHLLIEYTKGTCDSVTSGKGNPIHLIYDKINKKFKNQNNIEVTPQKFVYELVLLSKKFEIIFEYPQNIEWTFTDEGVCILQTRPITT